MAGEVCEATPEALRAEFALSIEALLAGPPVFYLWGGDEAPEKGLDCSGLVCWGCRRLSTPLPLGRPTADALWKQLEAVQVPEAGDLAEYGHPDPEHVAHHVMVVLADGRVAGMSGGGPAFQTLAYSKAHSARLRAYDRYDYRVDLLGFRRLPFLEARP